MLSPAQGEVAQVICTAWSLQGRCDTTCPGVCDVCVGVCGWVECVWVESVYVCYLLRKEKLLKLFVQLGLYKDDVTLPAQVLA